jgi:hypothetical protein
LRIHDGDSSASTRATSHSRTSSETSEVARAAPDRLDSLNMHPSMRLRIDHYLERRSAPYIG